MRLLIIYQTFIFIQVMFMSNVRISPLCLAKLQSPAIIYLFISWEETVPQATVRSHVSVTFTIVTTATAALHIYYIQRGREGVTLG